MMGGTEKVLQHVPPWTQHLQKPIEDRKRRQLFVERFLIGGAFTVMGAGLGVVGLVGLLGWLLP
jgi:hypothetical protein